MRARRTVKERDIVKILVFGYDRTLIKSIKDSGFRSMSDVISYANNMVGISPLIILGCRMRLVDGVGHILIMVKG
jgi:hypothetical protein